MVSDPKLAVPAGLELGDQQAALYCFVCSASCSYTQKDLIAVFLDNMTDSEWPKVGVLERRSLARWRTRVSMAGPRRSLELGIARSDSRIDRINDIHHLTVETWFMVHAVDQAVSRLLTCVLGETDRLGWTWFERAPSCEPAKAKKGS